MANSALCDEAENTLAAWLWLLVRSGRLLASEVEAALGDGVTWHRLLALSERGGERLIDALAVTAANAVPEDIAAMNWGWWLGLTVPLDSIRETPHIRLVAHAALDVKIDFLAMPSELAGALCEAFRLLQALLPMDLGIELFQRIPMVDERMEDYEALRDRGLLKKPEAALTYLKETGFSDLWYEHGEDIDAVLAGARYWLERDRYWPGARLSGNVDERANALCERTVNWRKDDHPLRETVWLPFIERIVEYVQDRGDLPNWFYEHDAVLSVEEMEMDLSVACCVLSSNCVEEYLLNDCREMIAQAGEEVVVSLALDASNRDTVWPLLQDMAVASGFLMWAQALADDG